jgi:membrane protease YdiL (CAAX protease family)
LLALLLNRSVGAPAIADETAAGLVRSTLVVQLALAILIGVTLRKASVLRERALVFRRVSLVTLILGLGVVLGIAPAANELGFFVSQAMHEPVDTARFVTRIVQQASLPELLLLGFALTLVPACVEELLFRGLLMGALSGASRVVMLVVPALLFGTFHVDWAQGAATFVLGLGFGFLRMTTGSLLVPMAAHATYNLVVLLTMRWLKQIESASHQSLGPLFIGLAIAMLCSIGLERHRKNHRAHPGVC